jgi:thiol:disulfide interchange protein DsbD
MKLSKAVCALAALCLLAGCGGGGNGEPEGNEGVKSVSFLSDRAVVGPGDSLELGILIRLERGWHTYADPPGDSGMAPALELKLPDGVWAGKMRLPPHKTFRDAAGETFGFKRAVMLRVPLSVDEIVPIGKELAIEGKLDYMICKDVCLPKSETVRIAVTVAPESAEVSEQWQVALAKGGWEAR